MLTVAAMNLQVIVVQKKKIDTIFDNLDSNQSSVDSKKVSFAEKPTCIDTMAQLDETLDDTSSVENLVIDETIKDTENKAPVTDTGQDNDEVKLVVNDLVSIRTPGHMK